MDLLAAILLGIIQGLSEWLPISSEAMVTLAGKFLAGLEYNEALSTAIWLHTGTMIAAIIYFRYDILQIIKSIYEKNTNKHLLLFLVAATFATAFTSLPLLILALSIEVPDSIATIIIGFFLCIIAFLQKNRVENKDSEISLDKAIISGLVQGLAILPGMSRSGLTISVLVAQKFSLKQAFRLSFLMSIPVTLGAQIVLPIVKDGFEISASMLLGAFVAAIVGLFTIRSLMGFAEKINFFKATLTLDILVIVFGLLLL